MKKTIIAILAITIHAVTTHAQTLSPSCTKYSAPITYQKLEEFRAKNDLLGLQFSALNADNSIINTCVGYTSPNQINSIKETDILRVGSITKTFIATTILSLYEKEKVQLNQSIDKWFPDLENSSKITVKMLLNQTSGIENYWNNFGSILKTSFGKTWSTNELVDIICELKPYAIPATTFYYSNSNYVLLAAIIELIENKPIHTCINDIIIQPLNLVSTYFLHDNLLIEQLITGYDDEYIPYPGYYKLNKENFAWSTFAHGAGAMASTTHDLCAFLKALYQNKILSQKTVTLMHQYNPQLQIENEAIPGQTAYGLGLAKFNINNHEFWGHMGGLMGFESIVLYCPKLDLTIAVAGNLSICNVTEAVELYLN